jgi:hypothetical protein
MRRRQFLQRSVTWAAASLVAPLWAPRAASPTSLPKALAESEFVYVSPLRSNGTESRCHAEVWYAWLDGAVVMTVSATGWKATAISRGLPEARIWVGDYGRWKGLLSTNERFRQGPNFLATGERVDDPALLEQLLAAYEVRYPDEIAQWRGRMRAGQRDGSRVMVRYRPNRPL